MRISIKKKLCENNSDIVYNYLVGSGKNYINIGIKPTITMNVEIEYYLLPDLQYYAPFGCATAGYRNVFRISHVDKGLIQLVKIT